MRLSVERARSLNPKLSIITGAVRADDVAELQTLGVNAVIQPEFEGGVAMVRQALIECTGDGDAASRWIAEMRAEFYAEAS